MLFALESEGIQIVIEGRCPRIPPTRLNDLRKRPIVERHVGRVEGIRKRLNQ